MPLVNYYFQPILSHFFLPDKHPKPFISYFHPIMPTYILHKQLFVTQLHLKSLCFRQQLHTDYHIFDYLFFFTFFWKVLLTQSLALVVLQE